MGKGGSGKDTALRFLQKRNPWMKRVVGDTTRPIRPGEQQGREYNFRNRYWFFTQVKRDSYLFWSCFRGWYYGVDKRVFTQPGFYVMIVTPKELKKIKSKGLKVYSFYLQATPSVRLRRMKQRECGFSFEHIRRIIVDWKDFLGLQADFQIKNNEDNESAFLVIESIMRRLGKKAL